MAQQEKDNVVHFHFMAWSLAIWDISSHRSLLKEATGVTTTGEKDITTLLLTHIGTYVQRVPLHA